MRKRAKRTAVGWEGHTAKSDVLVVSVLLVEVSGGAGSGDCLPDGLLARPLGESFVAHLGRASLNSKAGHHGSGVDDDFAQRLVLRTAQACEPGKGKEEGVSRHGVLLLEQCVC